MRGSKAKKLRRLVFGTGFHWPTVKKNAGLRRQYRKAKKARGVEINAVLGRRAAVNAAKANSSYSSRAQLTVLIALCALLLSGGTVEPKPYVWPRLFAQSDAQKSSQQLVYYMEAREAELWGAIVQKVADDLLIRDNLELAERITKAIEDSSREFGVDPWLVVALIRVESAGNPNAVSYKGARGLTQVMPRTGIQIARELGVKWEGPQMLHDVETSVRFGTYYLGRLLERFDGNIHAAVAAYFWGPENIARRLRKGSPLPVNYPDKVFKHIKVAQIWASS